jgi:PKHD-type hydroxylase
MNLKNHYYYFPSVLSNKFCNDLIELGLSMKDNLATVGSQKTIENKKDLNNLKKIRNSNVTWLNDNWIYKELHHFVSEANEKAGWNYQFDWSESCQFTKYKINQYYNWHCDSLLEPYSSSDINFNNKIRKLSMTVSLSDPKDYEGGDLEFDFRNNNDGKPNIKKCLEIKPKGSIVVFPSHIWHRVKPVKKGTRYSLVMWTLGYPFK